MAPSDRRDQPEVEKDEEPDGSATAARTPDPRPERPEHALVVELPVPEKLDHELRRDPPSDEEDEDRGGGDEDGFAASGPHRDQKRTP
jgi:hypothetical protein